MKLYSILILRVPVTPAGNAVICTSAVDVSNLGYFQRSSAKEFLLFLSRTVAKRVQPMSRTQVTEQDHVLHAQSFANGALVAVAICDKEYNSRVAFTMLANVCTDFAAQFRGKWEMGDKDNYLGWPDLEETLKKFQDPQNADKILKIQRDIEDTKIIMHNAIDQILERGEKIDNLVSISDDLGTASKSFYKSAKKTNSCCLIM